MFAYTNHTVLEEALEKWPVSYLKELFPRIMLIIEEIQRRLEEQSGIPPVIRDDTVHMAALAAYGSFSVNGVAALHSRLLKETVLKDWYACFPERFNNKTNGITHRRWLMQCNPDLTGMINELIGKEWQSCPDLLSGLSLYKDDSAVLDKLADIKQGNKERFTRWLQNEKGLSCPPRFLFDFQVKRVHEYKRAAPQYILNPSIIQRPQRGLIRLRKYLIFLCWAGKPLQATTWPRRSYTWPAAVLK